MAVDKTIATKEVKPLLKLTGSIKDFGIKPTTLDDRTVLTGEIKFVFPIPEGSKIPESVTEMARGAVLLTMDVQSPKFSGTE